MKNNIVLCGFMGCGKTTVGKVLAKALNFEFADSDSFIEQKEGKSISEIFAENGEEYFRKAETQAVKELALKSDTVIATGGGAMLKTENANALKDKGFVVFLDVSPETVVKRLKDDATRPLLKRADRDRVIKELMSSRRPYYLTAADVTVNADGDATDIAREVIMLFNKNH